MVSIGSKVFVPTVGREDKEPFVLATVLTSAPKLTVKLPDGKMVMPGEDAACEIDLITDIPLEEGQRFTVREGHKTVGTGIVSKILE